MKRTIAVTLLLCGIALVLATPAFSASFVQYRSTPEYEFCTGCGAVTGQVDSSYKAWNVAIATIDTTNTYTPPSDMVWGSLTDSLPVYVIVERVGGTGASTDSVQVMLQTGYGGGTWLASPAITANTWPLAGFALVGTGKWGAAAFKIGGPGSTITPNARGTYTAIPGHGAAQFRVLVRSLAAATSPGYLRVRVRYPVVAPEAR